MASHNPLRSSLKPKGFVTPEKTQHHAEILANRVRKRFRHLSRRFRREGIECFRLYDWDIKEVRAVVDWYAGHVVIAEYERLQTGPDWLPRMASAVAGALDVSTDHVHMKRRRTATKEGERYGRSAGSSKFKSHDASVKKEAGSRGHRFKVREHNLSFWVNLDDYLDTGLFSDHRDTRLIIGKEAAGKDFLNLYAYTGTFTCAAASGGAKTTMTVDRSATYLDWARENLKLNGLLGPSHSLVQSDAAKYLTQAARQGRRFTLALVDPPSFFKDHERHVAFDINQDHPDLIRKVLKVMAPGSVMYFSTNHQRFEPNFNNLPVKDLKELTPSTIPEDYRNRRVHRLWKMTAE